MKNIIGNLFKIILILGVIIIVIFLILLIIKKNKFTYVYDKNFLEKKDFLLLLKELKKYDNLLDNSEDLDLEKYYRFNLPLNSRIVKNLLKKYENKIRKLTGNDKIYLANNFDIEYRKYVLGSYMNKHRDFQIYKKPQYECVLTITNSTDSITNIEGYNISSKPNSLIIVKANGVEHEVTRVNKGERKFLKFIFTETDEIMNL